MWASTVVSPLNGHQMKAEILSAAAELGGSADPGHPSVSFNISVVVSDRTVSGCLSSNMEFFAKYKTDAITDQKDLYIMSFITT